VTALYIRTSLYFVSHRVSDLEASRFLFAFLFAEQTIGVAGIATSALLPLLASRSTRADLFTDSLTHTLLVILTAIGTFLAAGLIALSTFLTQLVGGDTLVGAEGYLRLLTPLSTVIFPAMALGFVYLSAGHSSRYVRFALVALVFNLIMNFTLVQHFGASASARITWVTELLVMSLAMAPIVRSGESGRRAALTMTVMLTATVVASELAAGRAVNVLAAGGLLVMVCLATARGALTWVVREVTK
jgi:O-antigen/teichoic acid export membrane protein